VPIARLLLASPEQRLDEIKFEPLLSVRPETDEKEVFEIFDKYNLRSLAVVDAANRPLGAITVDDIVSRMHAKL
jgi:magnesium transporter